jgi:hypothetical protein
MSTAHRLVAMLLLALVCTAPACLFDTRSDEVQPPDLGGNTVTLDDPSKVFVAISESFKAMQDANYERAISDRFIFSPTLQDSLDQNFIATGVYDNWNKPKELAALGLLLGDSQAISVVFNPSTEINQTTFVRFRVGYDLRVVSRVLPPDTVSYRGVAYFDVRRESGNWRLTYWDEIEGVDGFSSWGYLRGILGLQLGS